MEIEPHFDIMIDVNGDPVWREVDSVETICSCGKEGCREYLTY